MSTTDIRMEVVSFCIVPGESIVRTNCCDVHIHEQNGMVVRVTNSAAGHVVALDGALVRATAPQLKRLFSQMLTDTTGKIYLHLSGLRRVDVSGMELIDQLCPINANEHGSNRVCLLAPSAALAELRLLLAA